MGCGDVAVPTPRRNDSAWDVQLDDISVSGFGEMAKSTDVAVAQCLIEFFLNTLDFFILAIIIFFELFGHSSVNLALRKYLSIKMIPWVPRDGDVNTDNVSGCSVRHRTGRNHFEQKMRGYPVEKHGQNRKRSSFVRTSQVSQIRNVQ